MSRVTEYLTTLLQRHKMSQSDLAAKSGVPFAVVNRTLKGHTKISDRNWDAIIQAATSEPDEQAEALCCRLQDQLRGPSANLVEIRVKWDRMEDKPARIPVETPLGSALRHLRTYAEEDSDMSALLIDLARVTTKAEIPRKLHPTK